MRIDQINYFCMLNNVIMIKLPYIGVCLILLVGCASDREAKRIEYDTLTHHYDSYGVQGAFVMYDENRNTYHFVHEEKSEIAFIPASTFKILNSLIGLETGVIPDPDHVITWDSVPRSATWDKDHDMRSAYKNSTVWYYQELARDVGEERMSEWVSQADYGNKDISGGIDVFWLRGSLRISPMEQINFLQRLHQEELPFSDEALSSVKNIMIEEEDQDYIRRAKTGWATQDDQEVGWYVGYIETPDNVYYFANCVQMDTSFTSDPARKENFIASRKEVSFKILDECLAKIED